MLAKHARLTRHEFVKIPSTSSVYNQLGTVKYATVATFKATVVTSSKHEKRAVNRNRLRRRVYDVLHRLNALEPVPCTLIIYVSKKSYEFSFEEIRAYTEELVKKIRKNNSSS